MKAETQRRMARHWVALRRSGCPMGAAVFLGKLLRMVLCQQQQKPGMGWHRKENPKGAAAVETGIKKGNEPGQQVSMAQKKSTLHTKGTLSPLRERQDVRAGGPGLSWDNK